MRPPLLLPALLHSHDTGINSHPHALRRRCLIFTVLAPLSQHSHLICMALAPLSHSPSCTRITPKRRTCITLKSHTCSGSACRHYTFCRQLAFHFRVYIMLGLLAFPLHIYMVLGLLAGVHTSSVSKSPPCGFDSQPQLVALTSSIIQQPACTTQFKHTATCPLRSPQSHTHVIGLSQRAHILGLHPRAHSTGLLSQRQIHRICSSQCA